MASGFAHKCSGALAAAVAFKLSPFVHHDFWMFGIAFVSAYFGATAPDWMEIASVKQTAGGKFIRTSIIPHRTITHWLPAWIALLVYSYGAMMHTSGYQYINFLILFSFSVGGVLHLMLDFPNPTGIPIINPFKTYKVRFNKRYGLWKSGEFEWIIIPVMFCIAVMIMII